jgi:hypothetical protein
MKSKLGLFGGIGLGVFLFILFFQPFPDEFLDVNNMLIFTAGFGAIVILLLYLGEFLFKRLFQRQESEVSSYLQGIVVLTLCTVSFAFYLRYVGQVRISFPIILKVILICLAPPVYVWLNDFRINYRQQNMQLLQENTLLNQKIALLENRDRNAPIEFMSGNLTENIRLLSSDIVFVRSADNYVEILYREGTLMKKKLIRNTLNNIEQQLRTYGVFIRSHRTYIINVDYVESIIRKNYSYWLIIRNSEEPVPVSRQYLLKVKEAMAMRQG